MVIVFHSKSILWSSFVFPCDLICLRAATIIPRQGMLSVLFFSSELCGKIASFFFFFQKGAGRLSGVECKQKPGPLIRGLGEWIHDVYRVWGSRLSIRLPWPLMTQVDLWISPVLFFKFCMAVGGEICCGFPTPCYLFFLISFLVWNNSIQCSTWIKRISGACLGMRVI